MHTIGMRRESVGKYDKLKLQYKCLNGICKKCYYFGYSSYTCDYYLITKERRGTEIENCDKFFPSSLIKYKENALPYYSNAKRKVQSRNICITSGGRVFDADSVVKRALPKELICGEWKPIQETLSHNEILSSKPLTSREYKDILKSIMN